MRDLATIVLIIVIFSFSAVGQKNTKTRTSIIWSSEADCSKNNSDIVRSAKPKCSAVQIERTTFYIVEYNGLSYAMAFQQPQKYIAASVQITNYSGGQISVNPSRSKMSRYKTEQDFSTGQAAADSFSALSKDRLVSVSYVEPPSAEPEGGIRPGLQVTEVYDQVVGRDGRITTERTRIEPKAPPDERRGPATAQRAPLISRMILANLLESRDLADKAKMAGYLVFKTSIEKGFYVLFLNVEDLDFVFPIGDASLR